MKASSLLLVLACLTGLALPGAAQDKRDLLQKEVAGKDLSALLASRAEWHPYPTVEDRAAWSAVPAEVRQSFIREGEQYLGQPFQPIPASVTLRYVREGDRGSYDDMNSAKRRQLATLVLAEVLENEGRFLDAIADGIWSFAEQTYWGGVSHLGLQSRGTGLPDVTEPTVDLFAAEAGALLAWTDYLLGERLDSVHPLIRERIRYEIDRRILEPNLKRDDFWWMGLSGQRTVNNWNPWINSNWLATVLLMEEDPELREAHVAKILLSLDQFINGYPDDGASDEGPGYWGRAGASLFDNLELLRMASGGAIDLYDHPLIRNMGQYIYRVYIDDDYYVNTGDASAVTHPNPELVYLYGKRIEDPLLQGFGALLAQRRGPYDAGESTLMRALPAIFLADEILRAETAEPQLAEVWLPDLQLMAAREVPNSAEGLYLSALGGHNAQSHNHNDVGNFIVYHDGEPVLIDVGVERYSAKTFGPRRYEIWTMNSDHHNLPTINGVQQAAGRAYRAEDVRFQGGRDRVTFSLDIAPAYPEEAKVESFDRTLTLDRRRGRVDLRDEYELETVDQPVRLNLMTHLQVDIGTAGRVVLSAPDGERFYIEYDRDELEPAKQDITVTDARLLPIWGERVTRIMLTAKSRRPRDDYRLTIRAAE